MTTCIKQALVGLVSAAIFAMPSLAADRSGMDPLAAYDWSGPYFGAKLGGSVTGRAHGFLPAATDDDAEIKGILGGTMGGYNLQIDNIVVGLDGDIGFSGVEGSRSIGGFTGTAKLDALSTTRLRLGIAHGRMLPYVTGGLAVARADFSVSTVGEDNDEWFIGWVVGGGLEWAITDGWSTRLEYQYVDLGSEAVNIGGSSVRASLNDLHIVRAGVSMNTGWFWGTIFGR